MQEARKLFETWEIILFFIFGVVKKQLIFKKIILREVNVEEFTKTHVSVTINFQHTLAWVFFMYYLFCGRKESSSQD